MPCSGLWIVGGHVFMSELVSLGLNDDDRCLRIDIINTTVESGVSVVIVRL